LHIDVHVKCNLLSITTKRKPEHFYYNLHGHILESVDSAKYLGITLQSNLKCTTFLKCRPAQIVHHFCDTTCVMVAMTDISSGSPLYFFKFVIVPLQSNLKWNKHIDQTASKANKILSCVRRNLKVDSSSIKNHAYQTLVRPKLEESPWFSSFLVSIKPVHVTCKFDPQHMTRYNCYNPNLFKVGRMVFQWEYMINRI
jgi:hypothetical protein